MKIENDEFKDVFDPPHDFKKSLAWSHEQADQPFWFEIYRRAFPGLRACVNVRDDGWAQRGGIDRRLVLACGRTITVDEKVRKEDWPDILLERWSDYERKIPGWIQKPLACDFIAYAFLPSQTCYLFPTLTLQRAWQLNGRHWVATYGDVRAANKGWTTVSTPVPREELIYALAGAMCIVWTNDG
jgi:hypothetical protein